MSIGAVLAMSTGEDRPCLPAVGGRTLTAPSSASKCSVATLRRNDSSGLKDLTASEARRVNMLVARAVSAELLRCSVVPGLPDLPHDLLSTERINERASVGHGSGLPLTEEDVDRIVEVEQQHEDTFTSRQSRPPALDNATQSAVDEILGPDPSRRARDHRGVWISPPRPPSAVPFSVALFYWQWYCQPITCVTMAQQRGLTMKELHDERLKVLHHLRVRYLHSPHADLIALVRALP